MTAPIDDVTVTSGADATTGVAPVRRTARNALLLMVGGPLVAALGDPSVLLYAAPMLLLPALGAFLVVRRGRWASVFAAVVGLLGVAVALPSAWVYTDAFGSVLDVLPTTMFLTGGVVALVAGIAAARGGQRDTMLRPVWLGAVAVVGAVGLASVVVALTRSEVDPAALAGATEVRVDERGFTPEELALPEGTTVTLALRNEGRIAHTFTSDALDVDVVLSPGEVVLAEVAVPADVEGLQYWCVPHSSLDDDGRRQWMVGELASAG